VPGIGPAGRLSGPALIKIEEILGGFWID